MSDVTLPSGIVTFLFTDVVGSTRLFQQHGDRFVAALQQVQDAVRAAVEDAGGAVVNTEGDGTFAAFASAGDALRSAIGAQRAVAALDDELTLQIRAGLHTGYAQPIQGDYLAVPVHVASRVESAATPGQVLASGETIATVGAAPGGSVDLGLFELRDVVEPVRLWRVHGPEEPPRASPVRRTNVQPAHTSLVGRDALLAELADLVATHRLVTLVGTGGVGKTRVASELATRLAPSFPGGAWLVELAGIERDDAVPGVARGVLAVAPADPADDPLVTELQRRGPTLLVLDNCEHVVDGAAELADHLLRSSPTTRLLATSREALELDDERVLRLPPLDQGEGDGPAEELFRQRAARAGGSIDPRDDEVVRDVCRMLDGLPLAIELAARGAAAMPLAELRDNLERDAQQVALRRRHGEERQRSLDDLVEWSVRLLTPAERTDLMCLSAFPSRFTGADATVLLINARGEGPPTVAELVRRGLVDLDGDRYRLLFSVRVPMSVRLAQEPDLAERTDAAMVAWANQRVATARTLGWREALDDLAVERVNLEAALRASLRRGLNVPHVLQMLDRVWDGAGIGLPPDVQASIESRLAAPLPADAEGLRMTLSMINVTRGMGMAPQPQERISLAESVLAAARRVADTKTLVDALSTLAPIFAGAGRIDEAQSMYQEVIDLAGQGGIWHRPARDLVNMAVMLHVGPQPLNAVPWYEGAVEAAARTGDDANRAVALVNMGDVLMTAGRLHEASEVLRRGVKAMAHMSRSETVARAILADLLVRLDEPNSLDFARDAEQDMERVVRYDSSMSDYLERLRLTIAAAEDRAAGR